MAWVAVAVGTGALVSGYMGSQAQANAASDASDAQVAASNADIAQRQKQFQSIQALLKPYVDAGTGAVGQQQTLLGVNGAAPQQAAIDALKTSPQFTSMLKQGENSILANASATGGLRGGNTQAALAQFSPNLLAQLIQQQYQNLGGLTSVGQNAAAGAGNAGITTANGVGSALLLQGAAIAGGDLAQGKAQAQMWNLPGQAFGAYMGAGGKF
jgi:hypothetical protein